MTTTVSTFSRIPGAWHYFRREMNLTIRLQATPNVTYVYSTSCTSIRVCGFHFLIVDIVDDSFPLPSSSLAFDGSLVFALDTLADNANEEFHVGFIRIPHGLSLRDGEAAIASQLLDISCRVETTDEGKTFDIYSKESLEKFYAFVVQSHSVVLDIPSLPQVAVPIERLPTCQGTHKFNNFNCPYVSSASFGNSSILQKLLSEIFELSCVPENEQNVHQLFADLTGFQHRSVTALSSLTLKNLQVDGQLFAEELTAALSLLPEIKLLCVDRFRLSSLTLHPYNNDATPPKEMIAMILSRWWPDMNDSELNHSSVDINSQPVFDCNGLQRLQKVTLKGYLGYSNASEEIESVSGLPGLDIEVCD
ncbi:hypothetical protein BT96DRAFT_1011429 [Gymnopus androsaceus JB14]|uniref:Uncharacterized protein n=1 Tax=Gymnopus androsaceus JB14 TaxID=1447944 RepID=A0A6A4IMF5_9AGAR|nr:hypothetical protein BT96DRAFT_1011429 [Gymnopus androsaceus JB14]